MALVPPPPNFRIKTSEYNTANLRDLAASLSQAFTNICMSGASIDYLNVVTLNVDQLNVTGANIVNLTGVNLNYTNGFFTNLTGINATFTNELVSAVTGTNGYFTNLHVTNFTGVSGGGGLPAYGYAAGQSSTTTTTNAAIVFDLGGTVYPNAGITAPSPGGTAFTITESGVYEFNFMVCATNGAGATEALQIGLWVNGAQASSPNAQGYIFQSNLGSASGSALLCVGQGIISLTSGNTVTINNVTNSGTTSIVFTNPNTGTTTAGASRTLSLKRIA
jgi:hypothetical protein